MRAGAQSGGPEEGFTLPELMTTIAIMGILLAIAILILLGILEQRRVDAAANQLAADLRLAHARATNQLTDWRVVLVLDRAGDDAGPDYYLVRLKGPYPANSPPEADGTFIPRRFEGSVKAVQTYTDQSDDTYPTGYLEPPEDPPPPATLTFEFNSDGTSRTYPAVSGASCVTVDGDPRLKVTVSAATSMVRIKDEGC